MRGGAGYVSLQAGSFKGVRSAGGMFARKLDFLEWKD